jgi:methylthioribulose 1-phosphate dehydratase / enolase-phosphatase E1
MVSAAIPDAFYLDDPQDGVSNHLLSELGVTIHKGVLGSEAAERLLPNFEVSSGRKHSWANEHLYSSSSAYYVPAGSSIIDIRDSAGAWIRIVLRAGQIITLKSKVKRRIPLRGSRVVPPMDPTINDQDSRVTTKFYKPPCGEIEVWGPISLFLVRNAGTSSVFEQLYVPHSKEEELANVPHFLKPGTLHTRKLVVDLCNSFYHLGWVTGTGGSISIRHGDRIFMAPSSVQKERMQEQDIFVLDTSGQELYSPQPLPGKPKLKLSQCAPLFQHAFSLRKAGACIHTHDMNAMLCTLAFENEFQITHQEMIKGIAGHGFLDTVTIPIIENTPHECDLADSLEEAMVKYPSSNAVLVRRHGVYVWGNSWEAAKTQAECYHYLFEAALKLKQLNIDPAAVPSGHGSGIGASTQYGSNLAGSGGAKKRKLESEKESVVLTSPLSSGFHGAQGTNSMSSSSSTLLPQAKIYSKSELLYDTKVLLLDIEGTTTPISFVTEVLFPFATKHIRAHLKSVYGSTEFKEDFDLLLEQNRQDISAGLMGATNYNLLKYKQLVDASSPTDVDDIIAAIIDYVQWQMSTDRKTKSLKQLQGHIWRNGYANGELKGQLYDDVVPSLHRLSEANKMKHYIYSSGSREAQRLIFGFSDKGDVRYLLSGFFDTTSGPKNQMQSYREISLNVGVDLISQILFATDSYVEAVAATNAGMKVVILDRPGNNALPRDNTFPVIKSFDELN